MKAKIFIFRIRIWDDFKSSSTISYYVDKSWAKIVKLWGKEWNIQQGRNDLNIFSFDIDIVLNIYSQQGSPAKKFSIEFLNFSIIQDGHFLFGIHVLTQLLLWMNANSRKTISIHFIDHLLVKLNFFTATLSI